MRIRFTIDINRAQKPHIYPDQVDVAPTQTHIVETSDIEDEPEKLIGFTPNGNP